jgi:hypothetical protein
MPKFTWAERRQIRDCVIQCRVKRFSRQESLAFIKGKTGSEISMRRLDTIIKDLKRTAPKKLAELRESRYAFLDEIFKSKDEIEEYIKEAWRIYHTREGDPYLQLNCLKELHQLTISRTNILDVLPHYTAMEGTPIGGVKETVLPHIQSSPSQQDTRRGQAIF